MNKALETGLEGAGRAAPRAWGAEIRALRAGESFVAAAAGMVVDGRETRWWRCCRGEKTMKYKKYKYAGAGGSGKSGGETPRGPESGRRMQNFPVGDLSSR